MPLSICKKMRGIKSWYLQVLIFYKIGYVKPETSFYYYLSRDIGLQTGRVVYRSGSYWWSG